MSRIPTDAAIVDAIHEAGARSGYDPDMLPGVIDALAGAGADDDTREAIAAAVHRVWAARFQAPWA